MKESICKNCKNYVAHYLKTEKGFILTNCGHCKIDKNPFPDLDCEWKEPISRDEISDRLSRIEKKLDLLLK